LTSSSGWPAIAKVHRLGKGDSRTLTTKKIRKTTPTKVDVSEKGGRCRKNHSVKESLPEVLNKGSIHGGSFVSANNQQVKEFEATRVYASLHHFPWSRGGWGKRTSTQGKGETTKTLIGGSSLCPLIELTCFAVFATSKWSTEPPPHTKWRRKRWAAQQASGNDQERKSGGGKTLRPGMAVRW